MVERFISEVVAYIRTRMPSLAVPAGDDELRELIARGIDRARGYGLLTELDIWRFIHLVFRCGAVPSMDLRQPWALKILRDADIDGSIKAGRLWREYRVERQEQSGSPTNS